MGVKCSGGFHVSYVPPTQDTKCCKICKLCKCINKYNCVQKTKLSKVNECIVSCYVHVQHTFTPLVSFPSHPPSHSYTGTCSTILPTFCRGVLPRLHTPFPLSTQFLHQRLIFQTRRLQRHATHFNWFGWSTQQQLIRTRV